MKSLPHEILLDIFESLAQEDLASVLLTCKKFHRLSRALYFSRICTHSNPEPGSRLFRLIQSPVPRDLVQTFCLTGVPKSSRHPFSSFQPVYELISSFTQLKTFSLRICGEEKKKDFVLFPSPVLVSLLDSLSSTVVNLEFSTNGWDNSFKDQHICPSLRRVIPQLRTLRLQLTQLCPRLFWAEGEQSQQHSFPNLKIAVINLATDCPIDGSRFRNFRGPGPYRRQTTHCAKLDDQDGLDAGILSEELRSLYEQGYFPNLQAFLVVDWRSENWRTTRGYSRHVIRSITENVTTTIPVDTISHDRESIPRIRTRYRILFRDLYGNDLLCPESGFSSEDIGEGLLAWTTLASGIRLPPRDDPNFSYTPSWTPLLLSDEKEKLELETEGWYSHLWAREKLVGCKTLSATVIEGLRDYPMPRDRLPEGWEFYWEDDGQPSPWKVRRIQSV